MIILSETDNLFKAYSVQEIASMLGIGKTKTRELLDSGILPVTKVGRQYFTSPASIQENKYSFSPFRKLLSIRLGYIKIELIPDLA